MPNNQIELGEYTFALADMDVQGTTPNRAWQVLGPQIDLGPGAHVAEVYAEITAFSLDGGTAPAPSHAGTDVNLGLTSSPSTSPDIWQQSGLGGINNPALTFQAAPTLPQSITVGTGILSRYVQVTYGLNEAAVAPGANTTITFNISVLITSS